MAGYVADREHGFTLIEALVAIGILATVMTGIARLLEMSVANNVSARNTTVAHVLAQQKLEQLRALVFVTGLDGQAISDTTTDTGASVDSATGAGLAPSGPDVLTSNTPGYVDYIDAFGVVVGSGSIAPPQRSVYVRRWSVEPVPGCADAALVIQVSVTNLRGSGAGNGIGSTRRLRDEARVVTVRARKPK